MEFDVVRKIISPRVLEPVRVVHVGLHEHSIPWDIREEVGTFARIVLQAVQTHFHRPIFEDEFIIDSFNLQRLRIPRERILHYGMLSPDQLFEKFDIAAIGNDRQTFSYRCTHSTGVIEMMMRHDGMRERFVGTQCSGSINDCQRSHFIYWNLEEREMIVEFEENAPVISRSRKPPDTFPYFFSRNGHRR